MLSGAGHSIEASEEFLMMYQSEGRSASGEIQILVAAGAQLAQHEIVRIHAPPCVLGDPDRDGARLPVQWCEGGRPQRDAGF